MFGKILRAGDRVRMEMGHEARSYGRKGVPDGTLGTVIGKYRAENVIENRFPRYGREPGVYSVDGVTLVTWDEYPEGVDPLDPDYARTNDADMKPADTFYKEYHARYKTEWSVRNDDGSYNTEFDMQATEDRLLNRVRTGDLPETPFWELDIVSYDDIRFQIRSISYYAWGSGGIKGEGKHCYSMEEVDENNQLVGGGSITVDPGRLTFIERGNVWKEAHDEELVFHSLDEESRYATAMNRAHEVRNPASNLYVWTLDEVLEAIKNNTVDGFSNGTALFSDTRRISAKRFDDRDLGERVRTETLKGFSVTA